MTHEPQSPSPEGPSTPDPDELREQVERTRAELGDTVEALAAKADVKGRARDRAAQVKEQAAAKADALKAQTTDTVDTVRTKVSDVAHQAQDKLTGPAGTQAARSARDHRAVILAAAATGALVLWLARRRRKS